MSTELLDKVIRSTKEFFEMPLDEKKKKFPQKAGDLEGYGQAFVVSEEQKLDWADIFSVVTLPVRYRKLHLFNKLPAEYRSLNSLFIKIFMFSFLHKLVLTYHIRCQDDG